MIQFKRIKSAQQVQPSLNWRRVTGFVSKLNSAFTVYLDAVLYTLSVLP